MNNLYKYDQRLAKLQAVGRTYIILQADCRCNLQGCGTLVP